MPLTDDAINNDIEYRRGEYVTLGDTTSRGEGTTKEPGLFENHTLLKPKKAEDTKDAGSNAIGGQEVEGTGAIDSVVSLTQVEEY